MTPRDLLLAGASTSVEWTVEGQRVLVGWQDCDGTKKSVGRIVGEEEDGPCPTLWIGHDVEDEKRTLICVHFPIKTRTSRLKPTNDMFLVLPVSGMRVEMVKSDSGAGNASTLTGAAAAGSAEQLKFRLNTTSQVLMPIPRIPRSKPLDDMPGYLVLCLKSLCSVCNLELSVASNAKLEMDLKKFSAAIAQGGLESLDLDPSSTYCSGQVGGFNRWDCYPTTTDDMTAMAHWNPFVEDDPPAYHDACADKRISHALADFGLCQVQDSKSVPDEDVFSSLGEIGWDVAANPPKRKASRSPSQCEACSPSRKARLGQDVAADGSTEVDTSSEMEAWVEGVRRGEPPPSAQPPAHWYPAQRLQQAFQSAGITSSRAAICQDQDVRAPSTSRNSVTAKWRLQLKPPDAIFLDMVLLIKRALEHDVNAHTTYFDDFSLLGACARKAVDAEAESLTTTPAVELHVDNFTRTRDRLMEQLIADAVAATTAKGPSLTPNPVDQCKHLRAWINSRMQVNADVDLYDDLVAVGRAAVRLRDECAVRGVCQRPPRGAVEDDELWWDFEFKRALCIAVAFFKFI
ncbi:hypothetical protein IWZ01DRAFT_479680 [Phyllosticta capitalensis]